jgi:hypothetical protein
MSTFSFFTSDIITFLVSEITYLKKHAFKSQKSLIYIVLKIEKFSALDSYDVGTIAIIKFWTSFFCHKKKKYSTSCFIEIVTHEYHHVV